MRLGILQQCDMCLSVAAPFESGGGGLRSVLKVQVEALLYGLGTWSVLLTMAMAQASQRKAM